MSAKPALHFIGFKDPRYWKAEPSYYRAVAIFGEPDFFHIGWDQRAAADIAPGDTVVWNNMDNPDPTAECLPPFLKYTFDDSRQDIIVNGGEKDVDFVI